MDQNESVDGCIPPWLDKTFIASALKNADPGTIASSVELVSVSQVGGGYLSHTFRVLARSSTSGGNRRETSLIVKSAPPVNGILRDVVESGVFIKEKVAYADFLPAVDGALRAAVGDEWQPVWPSFYHEGCEPVKFLVIEDLDASGFRKVGSRDSLDLEQCVVALRSIARVHAASVALLDHDQYSDKLFKQSLIFNEQLLNTHEDMVVEDFNDMLQILNEYPWFRKYGDKLKGMARHLVRETLELVTQSRVDFRVMLHGDCHKNNMMFHSEGKDLQVRFYDFQGLHIGSPAEDLQYFLHTSPSVEVLRNHVDHLLSEYHSTLLATLRALGLHQQADDYPLHQLRQDMDHFGMVAVYTIFNILPYILNTETENLSIDTTADDFKEKARDMRQKNYRSDMFHRYIEYLIPLFDSKGLFERKKA